MQTVLGSKQHFLCRCKHKSSPGYSWEKVRLIDLPITVYRPTISRSDFLSGDCIGQFQTNCIASSASTFFAFKLTTPTDNSALRSGGQDYDFTQERRRSKPPLNPLKLQQAVQLYRRHKLLRPGRVFLTVRQLVPTLLITVGY